jgi:hypothetical protein
MGDVFELLIGKINGSGLTWEERIEVARALQRIDAELESHRTRQEIVTAALGDIRRLMPELVEEMLGAFPELASMIVVGGGHAISE